MPNPMGALKRDTEMKALMSRAAKKVTHDNEERRMHHEEYLQNKARASEWFFH
jgi:hypothetical protein